MSTKNIANMAKNVTEIPRLPMANRGREKNDNSSIGSAVRRSCSTKPVSAAAASTKPPTTMPLPQPRSGPSMMAVSSDANPTMDSSAPKRSSRCAVASRDEGARIDDATKAMAAMGTDTKNTDPYQKWASRMPPISGPMAAPAPANPAQTAMALARSRRGKADCRRLRVDGMISAAPMPMIARQAISAVACPMNALAREALAKMTRPVSSAPLRPKRSPMAPAGSSRAAKTRA